ncbi:hypothetical protein GALMADRAFT_137521 [Galerina marginata CBS 339.88]|uniref:Uncharacterized protein n=1 Tax=Galerina marginata (strain CBS 339.88) TaxID=685588 RepID=A0A067T5M6_GALM3|nr:hypothetical protein GALMADRAFT_137521 [Galerina marginata CBS 339.88]
MDRELYYLPHDDLEKYECDHTSSTAQDVEVLEPSFAKAKKAGQRFTLQIAETTQNPTEEIVKLLSYNLNRLWRATLLNNEVIAIVDSSSRSECA